MTDEWTITPESIFVYIETWMKYRSSFRNTIPCTLKTHISISNYHTQKSKKYVIYKILPTQKEYTYTS